MPRPRARCARAASARIRCARTGSRVSRREREAQRDCETREEFLAQAAESGIGAHAVAASADTSDDELRTSCCGAHSVAAAGRGAHSIPVLADEAACGAVERLGCGPGAHTVSKAGERVLDGLVPPTERIPSAAPTTASGRASRRSCRRRAPTRPARAERMARRVRGLKPRVSTAGAHEAAPVAAVVPATAAATAMEPADGCCDAVTGASAPQSTSRGCDARRGGRDLRLLGAFPRHAADAAHLRVAVRFQARDRRLRCL